MLTVPNTNPFSGTKPQKNINKVFGSNFFTHWFGSSPYDLSESRKNGHASGPIKYINSNMIFIPTDYPLFYHMNVTSVCTFQ